jgi:hypothetical protein
LKNFTYLLLAGFFTFILQDVFAQNRLLDPNAKKPVRSIAARQAEPPHRTCATDEVMKKLFESDPMARERYERNKQMLEQEMQKFKVNRQNRVQAIINVPVVVHIAYSNPSQVTDATVQSQIDTLNWYYGGSPYNQDSLRVYTPFRTTYGRSSIRFCLAQRTPTNLPTTGIERVTTAAVFDGSVHPSTVVAAWDPTKYLNIWVVDFGNSGILGYSFLPGSFTPSDPQNGFVNDYRAFGAGGSYEFSAYNQGKTAVHEIGHYFNLLHPWGSLPDTNPGCANDDFCSDTPLTSAPTFGCPTVIPVTNVCSPAAPGIMWQNHMDYADDGCMILFTAQQTARMDVAVNNSPDRVGLLTSNGCVAPPPPTGNDASISAILSPVNGSSVSCASVIPVVTIQNLGTGTLTSATINVRLNGSLAFTQPWAGSLAPQGGTANVTLNSLAIPLGSNTIKIHTTLPNGQGDANPGNDTSTSVITRIAPSALPTTNGFETTLLPAGWSAVNAANDALDWFRFNPTVAAGGSWAAVIDNYEIDGGGTNDDIVTPSINTTTLLANDSLQISFDLAYKNYPDPGFYDSLKILVTNNCGATWTTIWAKGGPGLATAGSSDQLYIPAAASDWKTQKVSIGNNIFGGGQVQVAFRNVGFFGNVLWLDNINIDMKPRKDMQTTAILRPNTTECAPPFVPSITVRNNGGELVTGFKTGYILNGGTPVIQANNIPLNSGESTTITFAGLTPPSGNNTLKMFVTEPITATPGPDGTPANDTLTRTFSVPTIVTNIIQGFEGTTFIPANWSLVNPNNNVSWIRKSPGKGSDFAAFIDNYNNNTVNQLDMMQTPPIRTTGVDSVTITFDLAHKDYPGSFDRLRVLASKDCGLTYTSVYSKSGPTLATAGDSDADFTDPTQYEWRKETVGLTTGFVAGSNNIIIQFENRNDFGNNIFIDNVNIIPVVKRDLEIVSVAPDVICTSSVTPVATIRNRGTETVTAYKVSYAIGTGAAVTTTVTGVTLAPGATAAVTLTAGTLAGGANTIKAYTSEPTTASGTGDQYTLNDTLTKTASVAGTVAAPANIQETFEGNFLPAGWAVANPDNGLTWQKAGTGKYSTGSALIRNYVYYSNGQRDALYTPVLTYTGVDSVKLSFDLSATTRDLAPTTGLDTLEVLVTKDCGTTFTSVYKKWGAQLQTMGNSSYPLGTEFSPGTHPFLWRTENIDLTSAYASGGPLQVVFRNSTNNQNDIYIDNVNLRTVVLPPRLKAEGVIVTPNPFNEHFNLWFVQAPSALSYIRVLNSSGQLIWNKGYSNNSDNVITVDLTGKPSGVYIVHIGYVNKGDDKEIKIIKAN